MRLPTNLPYVKCYVGLVHSNTLVILQSLFLQFIEMEQNVSVVNESIYGF